MGFPSTEMAFLLLKWKLFLRVSETSPFRKTVMVKLHLKENACLLGNFSGNNEQSKHQKSIEKSSFDVSFVD